MSTAETTPFDIEIDLTEPRRPAWEPGTVIQVGIVDEHEMFALGLRTCLAGSPMVRVSPVIDDDVDVVIASPRIVEEQRLPCPVIVCGDPPARPAPGNQIMAVLGRSTLTTEQLLASIHAAAAGLRVTHADHAPPHRLAGRGLEVLALLATGADTRQIAEQLGYSDRTIKSVIRDVQLGLGAKNRVQAVAEGIRQGLI